MKYLKVEDEFYYSEQGKKELAQKYCLKVEQLTFARNKDVILDSFENGSIENKIFYAPYLPEILSTSFKSIFEVIRVENKYGLLTKKQKEEGISAIEILQQKLGANVYAPTITFDNYIIDKDDRNFKSLMTKLKILRSRKASGIVSRGFFLTGIPGTGKTFFAKCIAGELKMHLIELNLSVFINADDTFGLLNSFFDFFKYTSGEYVILLDEIEKMFNGSPKAQQVLGYLLTTLNEYTVSNKNNKADALFIATANNVTQLVQQNPELFRKGRFDDSIYLTAPNEKKAKETFLSYEKKYKGIFKNNTLPFIFFILFYDENLETYKIVENSRLAEIIKMLKQDDIFMDILKKYTCDLLTDNIEIKKEKLYNYILNNEYTNQIINKILEKYDFCLNVFEIIRVAFAVWRSKMEVDRNLFPYVPAEIESIVAELYDNFYFGSKDSLNIEEYLESNTPLQISMISGIQKMNGATQTFTKL